MTVPGAVRSDRRARADDAATASCSAPARSPTPKPSRRVVDAGARFVVSPVFRRSVIEACHARDVPVMPGCFSPTEILDAWEAGADIVKVFPATALGPGYLKDVRGPLPQVKLMPTGGVTARQRRRLDSRRRGRGRRRHRADRRESHRRRRLRARCAPTPSRSWPTSAPRRQPIMSRVVTFGEIMLRLSPPGFERFLQSPVLGATFGGGEANVAVCLAQFGLESEYITRLPAHAIGEAAVRALRAEGVQHRAHPARRQPHRRLLRRSRREPARLDGHLRPRALGDQRDGAGRRRLERRA